MKGIEQMIKREGREQFYKYYLSLGYDHKVAACLALFTYGEYRFRYFSMDDLYDALSKGGEYLPPEEVERRRREEIRRIVAFAGEVVTTQEREMECAMPECPDIRREIALRERMYCEEPMADCFCARIADRSVPASGIMLRKSLDIPDFLRAGGFATDEYEPIEEKDARTAALDPMSTFRMTTNTASAGVILNQLRNDRRIDRSMVRIEEMLNYFHYDSEVPKDEMFNIAYEMMDADNGKKYLYVNVQGREEVKDRQNIIVLLDVSGSMHGNTEQTQTAIATIVSKLGNGDKISLVTYSTEDRVELEAFAVYGPEDRVRVLEQLLSIEITGCTYGSAGIERAYKIGKKNYIEDGNNQVILITDGDLNFGITDKGGLEELIERKKKDNLFLSVIGTGLWNYKDDKLEVLCKHGNGVYRTVNNLADVKKSIDEEYASLVNIIAKDVKAQVEFNPEVVESYRLLGFENRTLAREDFTDDTVISEPFGSGGYGVAVYELTMKSDDVPVDSGLKYSKMVTTGSRELGTVKVRYKEPLADSSHEIEKVIEDAEASFTDNLRLAFIVYVCAEKLRGSDKIGAEEIELAKKLYAELGDSAREQNAADLYKLAGILDKSERELNIGIEDDDEFIW